MNTAVWVSIAVVVLVIVVIALYLWTTRTALVTLRARVDEAWRDIRTQLQHRADLIPALLDSVQGAAGDEKAVFAAVNAARDESLAATTPEEATVAENHMQQALKSVFGVAEAFPQLMAGQQFLQLQADLVDTEQKIQSSRRFYNGGVREFNTKIKVFPNTLFARRLGFRSRDFFETADLAAISEPPRVQF
jgi:LemA protein